MCGIVGGYFDQVDESVEVQLKNALNELRHRGPNAQAHFKSQNYIAGHTRLSILDLDERANQPMISDCGNYTLVFNGEIYNFGELRNELLKFGFRFKTSSDTEVLLNGLIHFGIDFIHQLDGFFAFAFWNESKQELLVARDRLGIKPLVYFKNEEKFCFASELNALLQFDFPQEICTDSLSKLFQYTYVPAPQTILKNVFKLEPGCFLRIGNDVFEKEQYYEVKKQEEFDGDYEQASKKLKFNLENAVANRLLADVPLGTFLSGGFDSSIITGIAADFKDDLHTFSVGFKNNPYFDESETAQKTAKHFGTIHHAIQVSESELKSNLDNILDAFDEPFGDSSAIAVYFLARETKKQVTVALSGDGADELFAGYNKHQAFHKSISSANLTVKMASPFSKLVKPSNQSKIGNLSRKIDKFNSLVKLDNDFKYDFLASFNQPKSVGNLILKNQSELRSISTGAINDFLIQDQQFVLPNDMLKKVDLMSMRHSLEVRTPFLDHQVVEFANSLPVSFKIDAKNQKKILKDAFKERLPKHLFGLPKKGFEVPLTSWLESALQEKLNSQIFSRDYIEKQGLFHFEMIEQIKSPSFIQNTANSSLIWTLIVFQHWYNKLNLNA